MMYMMMTVMLFLGGLVLFIFMEISPILKFGLWSWVMVLLFAAPLVILLYGLSSKRLFWLLDKLPPNKHLMLFLRRDGTCIPVLGNRPYPGESFLEIPKLGLIHDLGKGSVYHWTNGNNIRFCLENVNHTPNPKFGNFTSWLYSLGFNNIRELQACIQSEYPEKTQDVKKKLDEKQEDVVDVLVEDIENFDTESTVLKPEVETVESLVDKLPIPKKLWRK